MNLTHILAKRAIQQMAKMNNLIHHNNRGHLRAANVPCFVCCYVNFKRHFFNTIGQ